jgi:hypothetical protein
MAALLPTEPRRRVPSVRFHPLGWETAIKSEQQARRPVNPNASSHERPGQICLLYLDGHYLYIQILCSSIRCQVVRLTTALTVHIQIFRFRMFHRRAP